MKACRIHRFGPPNVIVCEDVPTPTPGAGEVLVRVVAAGVGPWDGWIRAGKSVLPQPLPLTLGSDLSGVVEGTGAGVSNFRRGDEVYGVTNARFTGAYAELAIASAEMIARRPRSISHVESASMPVVAVTAWQMVLDYARVASGRTVLVHGGAGAVGGYAVQLARRSGARVIATVTRGVDVARRLGAHEVIDVGASRFEDSVPDVDAVIDTVGGDVLQRSLAVLKRGGTLVSAVSQPDAQEAARRGVHATFMLVQVTTARLEQIAALIDAGELIPRVGAVLTLDDAVQAHEMLEGTRHRAPGKIVLRNVGR